MNPGRIVWIVLLVLVLALLGSLLLNVMLLRRSRGYARFFNATRLDPLALDLYSPDEQQEDLMDSQQKRVVFYGDSRAFQWRFPASPEQFQFINRGADGQTSAQAVLRFDYHIPPVQPDILVLQIGVNDLSAIPWFPDQQADIIAACQEHIAQIVAKSRDQGAIVIVTTIFPPGPMPLELHMFSSVDVGAAIAEVNTFIMTLAEAERVIVLDSAAVLADEQGLVREEYSLDSLHINAAGYAALNKELLRLLADQS